MTKRVLIGKFPDGGYGLRVSQPGYDVTSNPVDNSKLVFNSDWQNVLALATTTSGSDMVGTLSVGAGGTAYFNHDLGYIPFASAFVNIGNGWEKYQGCNVLFSRYSNTSEYTVYNANTGQFDKNTWKCCENPQGVYSFSGNVIPSLQFRITPLQVQFYCSISASLYYMIYRMKAF